MREILFRGKQNEGKWVEGSYFKHDTVKVCFSSDDPKPRHLIIQDGFCDWGFEPPIHCVDVAPETVGQFTGLTDKNGKKIFEGDICRTAICDMTVQKDLGIVCYDSMGMLSLKRVDGVYSDFFFHISIGCVEVYSIEVIGNIHDNPELLEVSGNGN